MAAKKAGGRKAYEPKPADRTKVIELVALGESQVKIAERLGISAKTLRKHFGLELSTGEILEEALVEEDRGKEKGYVSTMVAYGIPVEKIARVMHISKGALYDRYRHEIETGAALATAKVAETLYKAAINGNITACIFFLKARAGWRETDPAQKGDGPPVQGFEKFDFSKLTAEQRAAYRQLIEAGTFDSLTEESTTEGSA